MSLNTTSELAGIRALVAEMTALRASTLAEAKVVDQAAARKLAREKKQKAAKKRASKDSSHYDAEKADKADDTKKKQTDPKDFANPTSFQDTPEDAHLHSDGKCDETSLRYRKGKGGDNYAKKGDGKCDDAYPTWGEGEEKARILGGYRQALERGNAEVIKKIEAKMRGLGLHPKGHLYRDMPGCDKLIDQKGKVRKGVRIKGLTAKMCKAHGQGGADEWSRQKKGEKSTLDKFKRTPRVRTGADPGHDDSKKHPKGFRLPAEHAKDSEYAKAGGEHGERREAELRHMPSKKRKEYETDDKFHSSKASSPWRRHRADLEKEREERAKRVEKEKKDKKDKK